MRVYCKCQEKAQVTKSDRISDITRHFYIVCVGCGREHHGTVHLDRETRPPRDNLNMRLINVLGTLSVKEQEQLIIQYEKNLLLPYQK